MSKAAAHYPGQAPIEAYGNGGFRFAGMSHRGSLLFLPSGIVAWPVVATADLTPQSFDPIFAEKERLSLLLLGLGRTIVALPDFLIPLFREQGMGLDVMDTGAAARTYNILLAEKRPVGAALIAVD